MRKFQEFAWFFRPFGRFSSAGEAVGEKCVAEDYNYKQDVFSANASG